MAEQWSSRTAFVLASIGAAVGLGNIWRFPYIASENGGVWFFIPYLACLAIIGIPLFLMETGQGFREKKSFAKSVLQTRNIPLLKKPVRAALGFFPVVVSLVITGYYMVLCAWTLWLAGNLLLGSAPTFQHMQADYSPIAYFILIFAAAYFTVFRGISKGIEPITGKLVPLLFLSLFVLAAYACTLPGALGAFQSSAFSGAGKIFEPRAWYYALSQVLFSLSVGYGIMFTYGMHLKRGKEVFPVSLQVAGADTAASALAFVAVAMLSYALSSPASGLALSFEALPGFFLSQGIVGTIVGALFFGILFSAAFTSVISMVEHVNASFAPFGKKWGALAGAGIFLVGALSALSYSPLSLSAFGKPFLDLFDFFFGSFLAPFSALAVAISCAYLLPHKGLAGAIGVPRSYGGYFSLASRLLVPIALLLIVFFSQISGLY
ncbi:MAG: hypothetical protein WC717_00595 [Candidatus Micrarchaeia archaeon]|jgi:NSS family neurotransmitter:Na+ symporter